LEKKENGIEMWKKLRDRKASVANIVQSVIRDRRSITIFKDKPVEEDAILSILDAARWAPSSNNSQPWEFVVVAEKRRKYAIAQLYVEGYKRRAEKTDNDKIRGRIYEILPYLEKELKVPPYLIVVCADPRKSKSYLIDTSAAIENMLIAAWALGLGTNWIDLTLTDFAKEFDTKTLKEYLFIPEEIVPMAIIPMGFPEQVPPPPQRWRIKNIIHKDFW
jgi:nitroreductase